MPPKAKVTKQDIINVAISIVRKNGEQSLNARNIATELDCSTQPIFSNFTNMEELRFEVIKAANELCLEYMNREVERGEFPVYKANGMAYIRFAGEERELFKLLYMRDRSNESDDSFSDERMEKIVQNNTGLNAEQTKLFHLEMWAYVHGIASMLATNFVNLNWELISRMLTDAYLGLRKQYGME